MFRFLRRLGLRGWKRWTITLSLLMVISTVGSVELTSQSFFCNSCHIMGPYYQSWKHSSHKNVECVKCHISPGAQNFVAAKLNGLGQVVDDVLHRTSMKPSASVSALSCTRSGCHDMQKIRSTRKTEGKFLFRHDKHLDLEYSGILISCSTCHSHVKGDEHFEVNTNVCVSCHLLESGSVPGPSADGTGKSPSLLRMAVRDDRTVAASTDPLPHSPDGTPATAHGAAKLAPSSCVVCHNPPAGTIERGGLKVTHSEYLSYGARCESCHRGTTAAPAPIENGQCLECHNFGIERMTTAEDLHRLHAQGDHKVECFSCHGTIHHGPTAQAATLDQFDCRKCHTDQHGVQRRTYLHDDPHPGVGGVGTVSPMFLAHVDCTGCHVKPRPVSVKPTSGAMVAAAVPEACDACHRPGFGEKMVPLWQRTTRALVDEIEAGLKAARSQEPTGPAVTAMLDDVRRMLDMVKADGSWGVHNPRYTQQILEQARAKLAEARSKGAEGGS